MRRAGAACPAELSAGWPSILLGRLDPLLRRCRGDVVQAQDPLGIAIGGARVGELLPAGADHLADLLTGAGQQLGGVAAGDRAAVDGVADIGRTRDRIGMWVQPGGQAGGVGG